MKIHNKIKTIRAVKGIRQSYMAEKLHTSPNTYSNWETGRTPLKVDKLEQICEILGVSLLYLITYGDNSEVEKLCQENNRLRQELTKLKNETTH